MKRRKLVEEDIVIMNVIEKNIREGISFVGCMVSCSGNTTIINYNHLFQYAKLNMQSYTLSLDLNTIK